MKITKTRLKEIIKEEMETLKLPEPEFTDYERKDIGTDEQMVSLLQEILVQLKMLNHHITPAKGTSASELEKAISGVAVAEGKE